MSTVRLSAEAWVVQRATTYCPNGPVAYTSSHFWRVRGAEHPHPHEGHQARVDPGGHRRIDDHPQSYEVVPFTDYHVDAVARFVKPGTVVISRPPTSTKPDLWTRAYHQARQVLETATDAHGRKLQVVELPEPEPTRIGKRGRYFLATYANCYVVNGAVILPRFGDPTADQRAASIIKDLHPGRAVVQLEINTLAEGGGGIHCATKQQPSPL